MNCRKTKSHVVDIEISIPGILPVDYLYSASFFFIPALVDYKEIPPGKNKFFCSLQGPYIIFIGWFLSAACAFAYPYMVLEAGSSCFVQTGKLLAEVIVFGEGYKLRFCLLPGSEN